MSCIAMKRAGSDTQDSLFSHWHSKMLRRCTRRGHRSAMSLPRFWASYIDAPENKSIYFRDDKGWVQFCTQTHYDESTVLHVGDKTELKFTPDTRPMLYKSLSPLRFSDPLYYGFFGSHQYILMFDRTESVSLIHRAVAGLHRRPRRPGTGNSSFQITRWLRNTD